MKFADKEFKATYDHLYDKEEKIFQEMSGRIAELQCEDGFWRASMLDPETYTNPETSGTGLFVYALAYGINEGYLSKEKYLPVVIKGWNALVASVDTEGKVGWVQPVGQEPKKVEKRMTQVYGTGGFLMAACEMYRLAQ